MIIHKCLSFSARPRDIILFITVINIIMHFWRIYEAPIRYEIIFVTSSAINWKIELQVFMCYQSKKSFRGWKKKKNRNKLWGT